MPAVFVRLAEALSDTFTLLISVVLQVDVRVKCTFSTVTPSSRGASVR